MIVGLQAAELALIANDFLDLLAGPDACDCVLSYETGTPNPTYPGKWIGDPVVHTLAFRGILIFAHAYRTDTGHVYGGEARRKFAEVPDADIAIVMSATINLKGLVNVTFDVGTLGKYRPVEKPAGDQSAYTVLYPSGQPFIQWIFAKAQK